MLTEFHHLHSHHS